MTQPLRRSPVRAVTAFLLGGLLALAAIAGALAVVLQRDAVSEAVRDARTLAVLQARDVVEPELTDAALVPGAARDALDLVVRDRVLGSQVVRVKIWDASGRIVYSDDRELVGRRFTVPQPELDTMRRRAAAVAEVTDLDEPENVGEQQFGKLLQVYLGMQTREGTPLLFETYSPYDVIDSSSRRLWLRTLPVLLGGLGLLYLVTVPLVWRLASQLRATQEQREQLLLSALAASDRERQRVAADLHDGVVQDLSGTSWALSAEAGRAVDRGEREHARVLERLAQDLRRSVRELRSLVVSITPPALRRQPLPEALRDLLTPLELRGVTARLDVPESLQLDEQTRELLLRAAQEAVRNVARHAGAGTVSVSVVVSGDAVRLAVADDGQGFTPGPGAGRADSVGLDLLTALVEEQLGRLEVSSSPGRGTTVTVTVPLRRPVRVPA